VSMLILLAVQLPAYELSRRTRELTTPNLLVNPDMVVGEES